MSLLFPCGMQGSEGPHFIMASFRTKELTLSEGITGVVMGHLRVSVTIPVMPG